MTRKDYKAIADAIRKAWDAATDSTDTAEEAMLLTIGNIGDIMAQDNPRFDRDKFERACGIA